MRTGSFFEIGSSHSVCEDFALHGNAGGDIFYSIVSDGCSSSLVENHTRNPINVDLGSKILCIAAKEAIENYKYLILDHNDHIKDLILNFIIDKAKSLLLGLNLNEQVFDCTLLILIVTPEKVFHIMIGDGSICYFNEELEELIVRTISYDSGAPFYISYFMNKKREEGYFKTFGRSRKIQSYFKSFSNGKIISGSKSTDSEKHVFYESRNLICENKKFMVLSDGILSFRKKGDFSLEIDYHEIIKDIFNFKSLTGDFIGKKLNLLHKKWRKESLYHFDDLSAGIIIG